MRRREFIGLLCGTAAWPIAGRGQQPLLPLIGFLHSASLAEHPMTAFHEGMNEAGYAEGRNVRIEYRWAEGQFDRLSNMAMDLVRRGVNVIGAAGSTLAPLAAKEATKTIPIVFSTSSDPIDAGLVASLNRPGGNITGVTSLSSEVRPKWLELLHELVPAGTDFAILVNPSNPVLAPAAAKDLEMAADRLGLKVHVLNATRESEFESAFARLASLQTAGLVITNDALFTRRSALLATLALRHRIPAIFQYHEFADAGGLMTYGSSRTELNRHFGVYIGRVLNGEKPADLPVQQATKLQLVINLKTAKAMGLIVPPSLLARAAELIE